MAEQSHAMPKGIKRVEKGVYRTLDDRHEIRQDGKVRRLVELLGDSQVGLGEFPNRGAAVAKLAEDGKLPAEAPAEPKPVEEMTGKELTEVKPELHPDAKPGPTPAKRQRKPRAAKPKATASA